MSELLRQLECPHCHATLDVSFDRAALTSAVLEVVCPACQGPISVNVPGPAADALAADSPDAGGEGGDVGQTPAGATSLDALRVRRLSAERRAMTRTRTHLLVGSIACWCCSAQLAVWALSGLAGSTGAREASADMFMLLCAAGLAWPGWWLARRSRAVGRQLRETRQNDPQQPPDFSPLSDGRHRADNLGRVR